MPGTGARFVVVLLAATAATITISESMWFALNEEELAAVYRTCVANAPGFPEATDCTVSSDRARAVWTLTSSAAVMAIAFLAAIGATVVRRRPLRAVPILPGLEDQVIRPSLRDAGLRDVALLHHPTRPIPQARADGLLRPYVEVGTNWLAIALSDPARAQAVLAHELAHLSARDVLPARVTWWLGPTVTAWGLIYLALTVVGAPQAAIGAATRLALALIAVQLARLAVLRLREHAADLAVPVIQRDSLLRGLGQGAGRSRVSFLATHPSLARRRAVVTDPDLGRRVRPVDGLTVGFVAGLAGPVLTQAWRSATTDDFWAAWVAWSVVGAMIGFWSAIVLRDIAKNRGAPGRIGPFAALLAAGLATGQLVFDSFLGLPDVAVPGSLVGAALFGALLVAAVALVAVLHDAFGSGTCRATPRRTGLVGALCGAVVLGVAGHLLVLGPMIEEESGYPDTVFTIVRTLLTVTSAWPSFLVVIVILLVRFLSPGRPVGTPRIPVNTRQRLVNPYVLVVLALGTFLSIADLTLDLLLVPSRSEVPHWYAALNIALGWQLFTGGGAAVCGLAIAALRGRGLVGACWTAALTAAVATGISVVVELLTAPSAERMAAAGGRLQGAVVIAVLGAFLVGGVIAAATRPSTAPISQVKRGRGAVVVAASLVALVLLGSLPVRGASAVPDPGEDVEYVAQAVSPEFDVVGSSCSGDTIDPASVGAADVLRARFAVSTGRPATSEGQALADAVIAFASACGAIVEDLLVRGQARVGPEEAPEVIAQVEMLNRTYIAVGIRR